MGDSFPASRGLHVLRRQRHSFLNHLQVISGWLQLDRPERARQYLESVAARMAGESEALRQATPGLALLMLELGLEAETHGCHLDWQIAGTDLAYSEALLEQLAQEVKAALRAGRSETIAIHLAADGFTVHSPSEQGKG